MNNTATSSTNNTLCPTARKQIGKTTYIVRVHFSQTAKETMEDKIKRQMCIRDSKKHSPASRQRQFGNIVHALPPQSREFPNWKFFSVKSMRTTF